MNGTQHTFHVLIVDDDLDFARSVALILKRKGYAISIAADGLAAHGLAVPTTPKLP